jgi:hypothetical protein
MIWDFLVIFLIIAFSYALAFKQDVPPVVTKRALLFFLLSLIILNIVPIISYLGKVISRIFFGGV